MSHPDRAEPARAQLAAEDAEALEELADQLDDGSLGEELEG